MTNNPFINAILEIEAGRGDLLIAGGVAAALHGGNRATFDIDLIPRLDKDSWQAIIQTLLDKGYQCRLPLSRQQLFDPEEILRFRENRNLIALTFVKAQSYIEIDLLIAYGERFDEFVADKAVVMLDHHELSVVSLTKLIAMKRESGRAKDLLDVEELEQLKEE